MEFNGFVVRGDNGGSFLSILTRAHDHAKPCIVMATNGRCCARDIDEKKWTVHEQEFRVMEFGVHRVGYETGGEKIRC